MNVRGSNHEEEDIVQDPPCFPVVTGDEVMSQFRRHPGAADLRGVQVHGLADHGLASGIMALIP